MPKKILINGYFIGKQLTGIERYAHEITIRLDKLISKDEVAVAIPDHEKNIPEYNNFEIIRLVQKRKSNFFWRMITLQGFLLRNKKYTVLDFGNTCLPFAPGIVFLHDIYCEFFPEDFTSLRDKLVRLYNRLQYRLIARFAKKIVTVSEFSKQEICKTFNVDTAKISIVYSSADHMRSIVADNSVFNDYPVLDRRPFYFSLGSLSKRKNLKWIIQYAENHPETFFAISGVSLSVVKVDELSGIMPKNIILLGYLDDAKVKALMKKCRALILPSYYEGFGLTPLEALSCKAQVIVAKAASLPEIYEGAAHYIDPFDTSIDLETLLAEPVDNPEKIFLKYSYDIAAVQVHEIVQEYSR